MVVKLERCTVQLLDDTQTIQVEFKKTDLGQVVLDHVCNHLNLAERDYFGLRYVDQNRHRYWLDTSKPILKQVRSTQSIVFAFRVKFYPADPLILKEELTRYLLVLQLRRDLLHGRLYCPQNEGAILGGHVVQAELGDYNAAEHVGNYVSQFKILLNQTPKLEEKIAQVHKSLKGQSPSEGDTNFLKKACTLDTYGYYPYTIKDSKAGQVYMGATPHGILVYQTHRKLHHLKWADVEKMDYAGKDFLLYPKSGYFDDNNLEQKDAKKKPVLRFICPSSTFSKHLWKYMLAEQAFFTQTKATDVKPVVKRSLLFRNSTFRYSGRVLEELKHSDGPKRQPPTFERLHMQKQANRDDRSGPWANKFHTMPSRSNKPIPELEENKPHEAPEFGGTLPSSQNHAVRPALRDSLLLDTTNQSSPIMTPVDGLSPSTTSDYINTLVHDDTHNSILEDRQHADAAAGKKKSIDNITSTTTTTTVTKQVNGSTKIQEWSATVYSTGTVQKKEDIKLQQAAPPPVSPEPVIKTVLYPQTTAVPQLKEHHAAASPTATPRWKSALKLLCAALVMTVFAFAVLVAVMEVKDENFRRYIDQTPAVDAFRHKYYDPSRQYVLDVLGRR